jgi:hypothetical protein
MQLENVERYTVRDRERREGKHTKQSLTVVCWLNDDALLADHGTDIPLLGRTDVSKEADGSIDQLDITWRRDVGSWLDGVELHTAAVDLDGLFGPDTAPEEVDITVSGKQTLAAHAQKVLQGPRR